MAWIRTISHDEATGTLRRLYDSAVRRAGKVFNVIRIQGLRPRALRCSTQLYVELMHATDSRLSRARREMIATSVSQLNACHY